MVDFPEFPHVQGIKCICRTCGALCTPEGWHERGGLCPRCSNPSRVKITVEDRVTPAIEDAIRAIDAIDTEPDPIRDAIDRAAADWSDDNPEDP